MSEIIAERSRETGCNQLRSLLFVEVSPLQLKWHFERTAFTAESSAGFELMKDLDAVGIRAISFCIYGSEDFQAEILENVIQNSKTRWVFLKDFTNLKESVVFKEYEIYYDFMVCSTDLHAVFKTEKIVPESLEAERGGRGSAEQSWCWPRTRQEGGQSG
ncbi:hypothetical protein AVEN_62670-1 [Araneus ventricosus]|uniref:Uncharacterized protein n=1 Tax=Araneus ventricosus TaxID=182803 RepID=A0A4Y2KWA1_ARAVE|nr:hypothetical protein AVEN_62670-1 [Araneus ventricosus]